MEADDRTRGLERKGEAVLERDAGTVLQRVYDALAQKGYDPLHQLVGYLLSGDPAYITSHRDARATVRTVGREELLEELVRHFVKQARP